MSGSIPLPARSWRIAALLAVAAVAFGGCSSPVSGAAAPAPASAAPASSAAASPSAAAPTSSPSGAGKAVPGDAFDDPKGRFDLLPPAGWKVDTSGAQGTEAVFLSPDPVPTAKGPFQPNVNVIVAESPGGQVDDLLDGTRSQLATLNAYKSTTDQDVTLSDGNAAHLFGGTFTDKTSGLDLQNLQLFTVDGSSLYVVTGTAPVTAWSKFEPVLDSSLRSLTLTA
jgi:hypothetical protein